LNKERWNGIRSSVYTTGSQENSFLRFRIHMTVLQQVKDYYLRYAARPTGDMARTITQNLVNGQDVKSKPLSREDKEKSLLTVPAPKRGRFVSQDA
jgi:hypothetical protein